METRSELTELTRKELLSRAVGLGRKGSRGNKVQLIDFILEQPLLNSGETVVAPDDIATASKEFCREDAAQLTNPELVAMLVAGGAVAARVEKLNKGELLDLMFPPEPEQPEPVDVEAERAALADRMDAALPTLAGFLQFCVEQLYGRNPEAGAAIDRNMVWNVARLVLEDCRLRGNPKAARAAIHVPVSAHNRRLHTVIRRVVSVEWQDVHRHVRYAFMDAVKRSLPLFFTNDANGEAKLESLFNELDSYFADYPPAVSNPIANPVPADAHGSITDTPELESELVEA